MNEIVSRSDLWQTTFTGERFYPFDPKPEQVFIEDIARGLANTCRWGGQIHTFYSVAQHSVEVSKRCTYRAKPWGLLHDAAEAYINDLPSPVKAGLPEYKKMENKILDVIVERFGIFVDEDIHKEVKHYDLEVRKNEGPNLHPHHEHLDMWLYLESDKSSFDYVDKNFRAWKPDEANDRFIKYARKLYIVK